jgi:tRNA(Arg) A34 adenosine deaminase TadA
MNVLNDKEYCRKALEVAQHSLEKGNLPFGCILVSDNGEILLEGENTVITDNDLIAHCEINLVHAFSGRYTFEFLNTCTVYASTEPCPMCSAALFWSGVGRLVYAVSKEGYKKASGDIDPKYDFPVSSRELLAKAGRKVSVEGPVLEKEGIEFYSAIKKQD